MTRNAKDVFIVQAIRPERKSELEKVRQMVLESLDDGVLVLPSNYKIIGRTMVDKSYEWLVDQIVDTFEGMYVMGWTGKFKGTILTEWWKECLHASEETTLDEAKEAFKARLMGVLGEEGRL